MRTLRLWLVLAFTATVVPVAMHAYQRPGPPLGSKFQLHEKGLRNRYIVRLTSAAAGPRGRFSRATQVARTLESVTAGLRVRRLYSHVLNGFSATMSEGTARFLSADPRVEAVEQEAMVHADSQQDPTPSWGLDRIDQQSGTNNLYNYGNDGTGITVYILDTPVKYTHQDFSDGHGGSRMSVGADVSHPDSGEEEGPVKEFGPSCYNHGTMVAGIIGGNVYGVAKGVSMVSVQVLNTNCHATYDDLIAGLDWVTENHAAHSIANLSLGCPGSGTVDGAVRNLIADGVTVVTSAGNDDTFATNQSPARESEAITVGATDSSDYRATYSGGHASNYGSGVDLFAPGKAIESDGADNDSATYTDDGTSFAAPFVTGIAARLLQLLPNSSPADIQSIIVNSSAQGHVINAGTGSPNVFAWSWIVEMGMAATAGSGEHLVSLQASDDEFVTSVLNGGGSIEATAGSAGGWETVTLVDLNGGSLQDGDPVAFRTGSTMYWRAVGGGGDALGAISASPYSHETFTLHTENHSGGAAVSGDSISLKSADGEHYVCAEDGGGRELNVTRTAVGSWETFRLTIH